METGRYSVSATPHIRSGDSIGGIMKTVLMSLAPAGVMGVYFFGLKALIIILISVGSCVAFEFLFQKLTKREITISDWSAAVTGILLAYNLPVSSAYWMPVVGSFFAIIIVKQLFGGLGQNFINPALGARAFLMASYTSEMSAGWTAPVRNPLSLDAISSATPLGLMKDSGMIPVWRDILDALVGNIGGCIGETCAIALILGGLYLLYKKVITWHIPVSYLGTALLLGLFLGRSGMFSSNAIYELLIGGILLGAFFMATDYTTSPVTSAGKVAMGVGCGVLTMLIRFYGGYPEGCSYAILIMNLFTPLMDRYLKPRVFGIGGMKKSA